MHPWRGNRVAIRRAVVFYARPAQAFIEVIKCRYCTSRNSNIFHVQTSEDWSSIHKKTCMGLQNVPVITDKLGVNITYSL